MSRFHPENKKYPSSDRPPTTRGESQAIIGSEALKKIALHALRFANLGKPKSEWREVYGFLIGKVEQGKVTVTDSVPMTRGSLLEVEFSQEDYLNAAKLNDEISDEGNFVAGWYHSHPGHGLFLSPKDTKNMLGFQGVNRDAIALVFDNTMVTRDSPGFDCFRLDELHEKSTFHKIGWSIADFTPSQLASMIFSMADIMAKSELGQPPIREYGEKAPAEQLLSSRSAGAPPRAEREDITKKLVEGFRNFAEATLTPIFEKQDWLSASVTSLTESLVKTQQEIARRVNDTANVLNNSMKTLELRQREGQTQMTTKVNEIASNQQGLREVVAKQQESILPILKSSITLGLQPLANAQVDINSRLSILESKIGSVEKMLLETISKANAEAVTLATKSTQAVGSSLSAEIDKRISELDKIVLESLDILKVHDTSTSDLLNLFNSVLNTLRQAQEQQATQLADLKNNQMKTLAQKIDEMEGSDQAKKIMDRIQKLEDNIKQGDSSTRKDVERQNKTLTNQLEAFQRTLDELTRTTKEQQRQLQAALRRNPQEKETEKPRKE